MDKNQPKEPSTRTRKRRVRFFLVGWALAIACLLAYAFWADMIGWLTGEPDLFSSQMSPWLRMLHRVVIWVPWLAVALVAILRIVKGKHIRFGSFFLGAVIGTVMAWVFLVAHLLLGPTIADHLHRRPFDAELWLDPATVEHDVMWPPRLCMVDDLISSRKLDRLSRDEVLALLGPPDGKDFGLPDTDAANIYYHLCPLRKGILDDEWLVLIFDEDDKAKRYRICVG